MLNIGIIGLGKQCLDDHIPAITTSNDVKLVGICDVDKSKLSLLEEKLSCQGYTDYNQMFDEQRFDFVLIAVPHSCYFPIIESSAQRGIHILKEKPFATSLREAQDIKEICEQNHVHLMTTLQRRFNPIYCSFFQLQSQIGESYYVEMQYTLFVENPHVGWRAQRKDAGGGCIIDMGYHMIDMLIWYFGLPDKVHAEFSNRAIPNTTSDVEDTASILFEYSAGLHGIIQLGRHYPEKRESITVLGTKGVIRIQRGEIKRLTKNGVEQEALLREGGWPTAALQQINYFCRVIRNEEKNIGDPAYHLQHARFIEACYLSKQKGAYINPKELGVHYER